MGGSDSDGTYCSVVNKIIKKRKARKKILRHNVQNTDSLRRSTRIKKCTKTLHGNHSIKQNAKYRKRKPRKAKYIDTVKNVLIGWNDMIYKHISKKKVITKDKAEQFLKNLDEIKTSNVTEFNEEIDQVSEKLMRQFKSIALDQDTNFDSCDIVSTYDASENSSKTYIENRQSISAPPVNIQNKDTIDMAYSVEAISCHKTPVRGKTGRPKKRLESPKNVEEKKTKSIIAKRKYVRRNKDSQYELTKNNVNMLDNISFTDHAMSEVQSKSNKEHEEESIPTNQLKNTTENLSIESQSILSSTNMNFPIYGPTHSNNNTKSNVINVRRISFSQLAFSGQNLKNDGDIVLPCKTVREDFHLARNNTIVTEKVQSIHDISIFAGPMNTESKCRMVESQSILANCDIIPVINNKAYGNPNDTRDEINKNKGILEVEIDSISQNCNKDDIHKTPILTNESSIFHNTCMDIEEICSKEIESSDVILEKNDSNQNLCTEDINRSSLEKYCDVVEITNISNSNEKTNIMPQNNFKRSLPTLGDCGISGKDNIFDDICENVTETVICTSTEIEIDNDAETIFNSMGELNPERVSGWKEHMMSNTIHHSGNSAGNSTNIADNLFNFEASNLQDQQHSKDVQSSTFSDTTVNTYDWLKSIDKYRKLNKDELCSKDEVPYFFLQDSPADIPLDLENEFKW